MNSINNTVKNDTAENKVFNAIYKAVERIIPFDEKWNNGTGYLNGIRHVELTSGEIAKSHTGDINNRKILLIGTMFGTMALFERYTNGDNGVIVQNAPLEIKHLNISGVPSGRFGAEQIADVFGVFYNERDDMVTFYPTTALPAKLEIMRHIFSGEYRRKINERLAVEE